MNQPITYLDPTAQPAAPQDACTPRLDIGPAPRIALFPNLFTDSSAFLHDLSGPLSRLIPGATFPYFDKQFGRKMSVPVSTVLKARILDESDAVVLARRRVRDTAESTLAPVSWAAALHHQGAPQMVRPTMSRMISADPAKMRCSRAAV
jgi:hypothetical protein